MVLTMFFNVCVFKIKFCILTESDDMKNTAVIFILFYLVIAYDEALNKCQNQRQHPE